MDADVRFFDIAYTFARGGGGGLATPLSVETLWISGIRSIQWCGGAHCMNISGFLLPLRDCDNHSLLPSQIRHLP
jgi:hypothetical protein